MKKQICTALLCLLVICCAAGLRAANWVQKTYPAGAGADGAFAFAVNSRIYVGGGLGSRQLWEYNPATAGWLRKGNLPGVTSDRCFGIGFSLNGKGYAGMGLDAPATIKKDFWEYDAATDTWTRKAPYPGSATAGLFCFTLNGKAYVGGGEDAISGRQSAEVYEFDPVMNTWTRKNDNPYGTIAYPFSFAVGSKGYIACGAEGTTPVCRTLSYDPAGDTWEEKQAYPGAARLAGISFMHNGVAWCGSGMDADNFHAGFYSYDAGADQWTPQADFTVSGRGFGVAVADGGRVFAGLGWSAPNTVYNDWWELDGAATRIRETGSLAGTTAYPNPARNSLFIRTPESAPLAARLLDGSGKVVQEQTGLTNGQPVDVSRLAAGNYILYLANDKGNSIARPVTIMRD